MCVCMGGEPLLHCLTSSRIQPRATAANGGLSLSLYPLSLSLSLSHTHQPHSKCTLHVQIKVQASVHTATQADTCEYTCTHAHTIHSWATMYNPIRFYTELKTTKSWIWTSCCYLRLLPASFRCERTVNIVLLRSNRLTNTYRRCAIHPIFLLLHG